MSNHARVHPTAGSRGVWALFACVLIVMIGVGITLPIVPLYVERLALAAGSNRIGLHVGLLTAVYPLTQLVFAPLWGRLSDRIGRRPLIVVGIVGFALTQLLFGMASGLVVLYTARFIGGALSSALLPVASAYVADATTPIHRARGMARLNTAVGLGTLIGPAIGGLLGSSDVHVRVWGGHLFVDGFSIPFFAASALAIGGLVVALARLPGSHASVDAASVAVDDQIRSSVSASMLLGVAAAGYLAITMFEATFSLFAVRIGFEAGEIGAAFMVCGGVMLIAQLASVPVAARIGEIRTIALGFGVMSFGLTGLVFADAHAIVFTSVGFLGAGMSLIGPSLAALVSKHRSRNVGRAMGLQQSAQGLGQVAGSLIGVLLFGWRSRAPYVTAAVVMVAVGVIVAIRRSPHPRASGA